MKVVGLRHLGKLFAFSRRPAAALRTEVKSLSDASSTYRFGNDTLMRKLQRWYLPCSCQHQCDVIRLLGAADPVVDGGGDNFRNAFKGKIAVVLDQYDQPLFTELAKVILRFGDSVAVRKEEFVGPKLHRIFVVVDVVAQSNHRAALFESLYDTALREHQRR
jgi:hypothetical protein